MAKDVLKRKNPKVLEQMSIEELIREIRRVECLRNFNKRSRTRYANDLTRRYYQLHKAMILINPNYEQNLFVTFSI